MNHSINPMNSSRPGSQSATIAARLKQNGFIDGNIEKDLGTVVKGLIYLEHEIQGQFQYVSICSYAEQIVETVLLVYPTRFNSRAKPPMIPIFSGIFRSEEELYSAVQVIYELPKKK